MFLVHLILCLHLQRASVSETVQSKVPCHLIELRPDEDNSVRLSSQSGNAEALCKKTSDLDSVPVGSTQLSSQLRSGEVLRKNNIDVVPKQVETVLLPSQAGTEEVLCKGVTDSGPGFVASTLVWKQLVTKEALCKSISNIGPEDAGLMPSSNLEGTEDISNYSHKETLCIKATEVCNTGPGHIDSALSGQSCSGHGTEVCQVDNCSPQAMQQKESDTVTEMCGLAQLSSQLVTEEASFKGVSDIKSEQVNFTLSNQSSTREVLSKGVNSQVIITY